jgi:hypothetical protein
VHPLPRRVSPAGRGANEHAAEGLEILGVVHDDAMESARAFAADMEATWPLLNDPADQAWNAYLGTGVPMTYFIDPAASASDP